MPSSDRLYGPDGRARGRARADLAAVDGPQSRLAGHGVSESAFQYQFRFDGYVRDRTTAESFELPPSTVTNGFGGAWEYRRGGYSLGDQRHRGTGRRSRASSRTYTKYTASLSRDFYFNAVHKIHLNGAWFGGQRLDRFSKYQFGMFDDTRIHGVPASGVRFDELAMARGSYSFNLSTSTGSTCSSSRPGGAIAMWRARGSR